MLSIAVNADALNQAVLNLQATEDQARKALNSTMNKMAAWVRTRAVRGLSSQLQIQQKILRQRVRSYRLQSSLSHATGDGSMKVWFGLNPIPWGALKPRQAGKGVSIPGGRHDPSAFIVERGGRLKVYRRQGAARVPLEVLKVDIADQATDYIEQHILAAEEFHARFITIFERELKWRTRPRR